MTTGAVVKSITDVDTSRGADFSNLPPMWVTPPGGGLHLVTQTAVDTLGRATQVTDANGNVTYRTYNDPAHEARTYHWDVTAPPASGRVGPTAVSRTDRPGGYSEALTTTDAPHLSNNAPDGSEQVTTAGLQTLSRSYTNQAGQVVRADAYFSFGVVAARRVQVRGAFLGRLFLQSGEEDRLDGGEIVHGRTLRKVAPGDSATKTPRTPQPSSDFSNNSA